MEDHSSSRSYPASALHGRATEGGVKLERDVGPLWPDTVFVRGQSWYVKSPVDGELGPFATKEDAAAWITAQDGERKEIERWARIIDDREWQLCEENRDNRRGFMFDVIFASLADAKRIRAALTAQSGDHEEPHAGNSGTQKETDQ